MRLHEICHQKRFSHLHYLIVSAPNNRNGKQNVGFKTKTLCVLFATWQMFLKIYESSYMENQGYKPLQINVLFDFSSINPHKMSHVFVILTKLSNIKDLTHLTNEIFNR